VATNYSKPEEDILCRGQERGAMAHPGRSLDPPAPACSEYWRRLQETRATCPVVYLDFMTRRGWSHCYGVADQTHLANVPIGLRTTFYIVMCDIDTTTFESAVLS